ncbi:MAG: thiolase family protein [Candidatus Bathyarchaeota archaeon]|nr:MAG: thiolase family protein [Candidatus Bathyarchaeota archaeon]
MMEKGPAVVGVGRTKFGEHYEREPEDLVEEAGLGALASVGVEREDLDACFFADYFLPITNKIGLEEGFLSELLELNIPMEITRSFSSALSNASNAIQAGKYSLVLVGGMEKMTDRWDKIRDDLMLLEDPWSYYAGGTHESNHELMLRSYLKTHNIHNKERTSMMHSLAELSVRNHENALKNEFAQFQRRISVDAVLKSRRELRRPLGLYDFAPVSDGASALILTNSDSAGSYTSDPVNILGYSLATDFITFPSRGDLTGFLASRIAMKEALEEAEVGLNEISILQMHDQSTLVGLVTLEDLGFYERGKAWKGIQEDYNHGEGCYEVDCKRLFVNVNGGLKADGNPLGATGGAHIHEVFRQLRGEAGQRQVKVDTLQNGCVHELEGFGTKAYVFLLGVN